MSKKRNAIANTVLDLLFAGKHGDALVFIVLAVVCGGGFILDLVSPEAGKWHAFQRSGALATAIFVPWFAYLFANLTLWRAHQFAERARLEAKEMLKLQQLAKIKEPVRSEFVDKLDEVLKIPAQRADVEALEPTLSTLEHRSMKVHAASLFLVTLIAGFGDLLMMLVHRTL